MEEKGREERGRATEGFSSKYSNLIFFNSQSHHLSEICLLNRKFIQINPQPLRKNSITMMYNLTIWVIIFKILMYASVE